MVKKMDDLKYHQFKMKWFNKESGWLVRLHLNQPLIVNWQDSPVEMKWFNKETGWLK